MSTCYFKAKAKAYRLPRLPATAVAAPGTRGAAHAPPRTTRRPRSFSFGVRRSSVNTAPVPAPGPVPTGRNRSAVVREVPVRGNKLCGPGGRGTGGRRGEGRSTRVQRLRAGDFSKLQSSTKPYTGKYVWYSWYTTSKTHGTTAEPQPEPRAGRGLGDG